MNPVGSTQPLDEAAIRRLVERFYERARAHPTLGPVFEAAVTDWDGHTATLVRFWSSVELRTGEYRGRPMDVHRAHPIDAGHFHEWLALWATVAGDVLPPEHAARFVDHSRRIAASLMYGLGLDPDRRPLGLPVIRAD